MTYMSEGTDTCVYKSLGGLAAVEGTNIQGETNGSLEEAKANCDSMDECESLAFCGNSNAYYLYSQKFDGSEDINPVRVHCVTYYKECQEKETKEPTKAPTDTLEPTKAPTDTPQPTKAPTDTPQPTKAPTD